MVAVQSLCPGCNIRDSVAMVSAADDDAQGPSTGYRSGLLVDQLHYYVLQSGSSTRGGAMPSRFLQASFRHELQSPRKARHSAAAAEAPGRSCAPHQHSGIGQQPATVEAAELAQKSALHRHSAVWPLVLPPVPGSVEHVWSDMLSYLCCFHQAAARGSEQPATVEAAQLAQKSALHRHSVVWPLVLLPAPGSVEHVWSKLSSCLCCFHQAAAVQVQC
jgi:hypothetical protein